MSWETFDVGISRRSALLLGASMMIGSLRTAAASADEAGPLSPHVGGQITTAFSNGYGADAESVLTFAAIGPDMMTIQYMSTRGLHVLRNLRATDREHARMFVMGYADSMPATIPGSTSLGISGDVLRDLRSAGRADLSLAYDAKLSKIDGTLQMMGKEVKVPLIVESQVTEVAAVRASGKFGSGQRTGEGQFLILSNVNGPLMLESVLKFSWEKQVRRERITRVSAGASMKSAMAQSLSTLRKYDVYGLHFGFDKADLLPESEQLLQDIATTLKSNPKWTLQIVGHTDAIGEAAYNLKLSAERAAAVAEGLARIGVGPERLTTAGMGETQPKGDNSTLDGRALNRRVELVRTDR